MTELVESPKYVTIEEICDLFSCHRNTADKLVANCQDFRITGKGRKLYNIHEINKIRASQFHQQQIVKLDNRTDRMMQRFSNDELKIAFGKSLENRTSDEIGNMGLELIAIAIQKQKEAQKKELEQKNKLIEELEFYKQENQQIHEEKYKRKVLIAKINKTIRAKAYGEGWSYSETYTRYYKLYDLAHCFGYREDYKNYIKVIAERGDLLEFYELVLNK